MGPHSVDKLGRKGGCERGGLHTFKTVFWHLAQGPSFWKATLLSCACWWPVANGERKWQFTSAKHSYHKNKA
eukprot:5383590-Alexandrium_andersonii.AAC.1